ncbi:DUF2332 family protein [Flexivirga sp. ID2601S]|uniref:DUF2332 family protein n=1 Tax=Flexivirga aerilata TaxID=1656889 RepID=A0A849ADW1_9MICO|nr:DUF2332 family protein [Flexivirga aerilata]NNG38097.1 DUF2332 family protein [Flexivirga aerilata]
MSAVDVAQARAAFAAAADAFDGPLYRHWCRTMAAETGRDDRTFTAFGSYGLDFGDWRAAQRLLRVTSLELRRAGRDHPLADYFPVLGGTLPPDGRSYQLWTELLRDRRGPIGRRLQEPSVPLNDPIAGLRIMRLLHSHLTQTYAEPVVLELLAVGAAGGLELVADGFQPGLLDGQHIVRRRGVDLDPLDTRDPQVRDEMLALLEPEDVAAQDRVQRAARLVAEQDIVVSRQDAFDAVSKEGFGFGRLPVVFGVSFLCGVDDPERMDQLMRARHAEGIWISDETAGVLARFVDDPQLRDVPPSTRVTRLAHYRGGEALAIRTNVGDA